MTVPSAAQLSALAASIAWGVADFSGGWAARRAPVLRVLVWAQPTGLVLIIAAWWSTGHPVLPTVTAVWAVVAGVAALASLASLYGAMAIGTMTLVAPLAAIGVVLPVAVGLAGGDPVTGARLLGMILAVVGTLATTTASPGVPEDRTDDVAANPTGGAPKTRPADGPGHPTSAADPPPAPADSPPALRTAAGRPSRSTGRAALLALGSATGQGLFLVFLARASAGAGGGGPLAATAVMRSTSCLLVAIVSATAGHRTRRYRRRTGCAGGRVGNAGPRGGCAGRVGNAPGPTGGAARASVATPAEDRHATAASELRLGRDRSADGRSAIRSICLMAAVGLFDALAEVLFAGTSARGRLSDAAVLSSLYPAVTMLLAVAILRERPRPAQSLGAIAVLGGVVLLSMP